MKTVICSYKLILSPILEEVNYYLQLLMKKKKNAARIVSQGMNCPNLESALSEVVT